MYIIICETDRQSMFDAWERVLRAGALGWPRGMGWGGRWEGGSGWGTHVNSWLIHINVWQKPLQYCKVISLQLNKFLKERISVLHVRDVCGLRGGLRGHEEQVSPRKKEGPLSLGMGRGGWEGTLLTPKGREEEGRECFSHCSGIHWQNWWEESGK